MHFVCGVFPWIRKNKIAHIPLINNLGTLEVTLRLTFVMETPCVKAWPTKPTHKSN